MTGISKALMLAAAMAGLSGLPPEDLRREQPSKEKEPRASRRAKVKAARKAAKKQRKS